MRDKVYKSSNNLLCVMQDPYSGSITMEIGCCGVMLDVADMERMVDSVTCAMQKTSGQELAIIEALAASSVEMTYQDLVDEQSGNVRMSGVLDALERLVARRQVAVRDSYHDPCLASRLYRSIVR